MNKKKISIISLGVGLLGTALAVKVYKDKKNETVLSKLTTQSNVIDNVVSTLENHFEILDSLKNMELPSVEVTKRTLVTIKKIQRQFKIISKLKDIDNVPDEIADIYEDVQALKNKLIEAIEGVDIFNEASLDYLRRLLLTFRSTIDIVKTDIASCEEEETSCEEEDFEEIEKFKPVKKEKQHYSIQKVPFNDYDITKGEVAIDNDKNEIE